jgi:polyisoprenoid-binding protein YceI
MSPTTNDIAVPGYVAGTWKVDPDHSKIEFAIRQLGVKVRGRFAGYDVTITTAATPPGSFVTATIELASIDTGNKRRDGHLLSSGLLKVEDHPTMTYRSSDLRRSQDGWIVDGDLTIHGVTRSVPLVITENHFAEDAPGERRATLCATAQISRRDFGVPIAMDAGGAVVGDKIWINLEMQAVRQA